MINSSQEKVFLETNTQFIRLFGTIRQKKVVSSAIRDKICYSSLFVFKEFRLLVTLNLIRFYSFIDYCPSVGEALKEFVNSYSFEYRKIKALIDVLASELSTYSNKEEAKSRLQLYMIESEKNFKDGIDFMIDHVKCHLSHVSLPSNEIELLDFPDNFTCSAQGCELRLFKFKKSQLEMLNKLNISEINLNKKKKEEFQSLQQIYNKILTDIDLSDDELLKLGDTIIALECPKTTCLLTYDEIFIIYCPVLGLQYEVLKHPPTLKKIIKMIKTKNSN